MSRTCPKCGREYFGQTMKCIHCNCALVEKSNSTVPRQTRGRTTQQTRQTAAQINYQRVQQARAEQEKEKRRQLEQIQAQQQALLAEQEKAKASKYKNKHGRPMSGWKLVSGILSIIIALMAISQSRSVFLLGSFVGAGELSGIAGIFTGLMILAGGIVSIACRKGGKGSRIAIAILFGTGAFIGVICAGIYVDLVIYSLWCLVCMIFAILSASGNKKSSVITIVSLTCIWVIFSLFSGSGSESSSSRNSARLSSRTVENSKTSHRNAESTYKIGQTWTVDGQWKLKINSVRETDERNEWSEKNPKSVYIVDYTYENIGYEDDYLDGLYFSISGQTITDSTGKVGYSYSLSSLLSDSPTYTPVGAYCDAKDSVGVDNSGTFKIYITKYDGNDERQSAVFELNP